MTVLGPLCLSCGRGVGQTLYVTATHDDVRSRTGVYVSTTVTGMSEGSAFSAALTKATTLHTDYGSFGTPWSKGQPIQDMTTVFDGQKATVLLYPQDVPGIAHVRAAYSDPGLNQVDASVEVVFTP